MTQDLNRATELLEQGGYTCVLCRRQEVLTTRLRGVRPLVQWLESGRDLRDFRAADRVVGKATAFLYVLLEIRAVHARVMSEGALAILTGHGIRAQYGTLVPHIINRAGDGICPFEAAVENIREPQDALQVILAKMEEMGIPR